jgi:hypothetical protein
MLLEKFPDSSIREAVDGISYLISSSATQIATSEAGVSLWVKIWPIAVDATNARYQKDDNDLNSVVRGPEGQEPKDLDTLNTSAGRLIDVLLGACPTLDSGVAAFEPNSPARIMRDAAINASGRSGLIVRHRLIESLSYFFRADRDWTEEYLIKPLLADNSQAISLWRAAGRGRLSRDVLKRIGSAMVDRAIDPRIGRETRQSLVFSLVVDALHALHRREKSAVEFAKIQQMIRSLDDEVRAHAANTIQQFVHEISAKNSSRAAPPTAGNVFRMAAKPFLHDVWPQERSLTTPGVSRALADLPATSRDAFAEAVDSIERFLVPFECWSMLDYGLFGEEDGDQKLTRVITSQNADAFVRLLDLTIGAAENSIIPFDLASALDHVQKVAPHLTVTQAFRRLATAARRA